MPRPYRALCGIVLGLAVIVGCAKKPKTDSVSNSSTEPTPAPSQSSKNGPPGGPVKVQPTGGKAAVESAPIPPKDEPKNDASTVAAITTVELQQVRFDKVEAALTAAKGKVVLVDCWARWCPPCISSFPKLVEKNEKYGAKGLVCLSVSLDGGQKRFTPEQVLEFLKEKNAKLQNFYLSDLRSDNAVMEARFGQISGIPHAVLFNRTGEKVWTGHPMEPALVTRIEAELAK